MSNNDKLAEITFSRSFAWNEEAPGRQLIAFGDFGYLSPIIIASSHRDSCTRFKCSGSNGFKTAEELQEADSCENCRFCTGVYSPANTASLQTVFDMTAPSPEAIRYTPAAILVPPGCPHAGEWTLPLLARSSSEQQPFNRKQARCIYVNDSRDISFPHSWKVYSKDGKVSLTVQYCKMYVNSDTETVNTSYYYQTIQANVIDGQTYISSIHNGKKKLRKGSGTGNIDNITYTGKSVLFEWNQNSIGYKHIKTALFELAKAIANELSQLGYCKPMTARIADDADAAQMLSDITALNRFPMALQHPLPQIYANISEKARYSINDIRRDVQVWEFPKFLGVPDDPELSSILSDGTSGKRDLAFILSKAGCEDVTAYKYALRDDVFPQIVHPLSVLSLFVPHGNADGISLIPLIVANSFSPGGWMQWLAELSSVSDISDETGLHGARLAFEALLSTGQEIPDEQSVMAFTNALLDANKAEQKRRSDDKYFTMYNEFNTEELTWKCRKYGCNWTVAAPSSSQPYGLVTRSVISNISRGISLGFVKLMELRRGGDFIALIEVRSYFHIDRRKWTTRHQREYLRLKQSTDLNPQEKERKEELRKMMREAVKFDWAFKRVHSGGLFPIDKHVECVIRLWAKERKVTIYKKDSADLKYLVKREQQ